MESIISDIPLRLVIVSGASGSGKTQTLKCLEDLGFFCVDNLPPALFPKFTELCDPVSYTHLTLPTNREV